MSEAEGTVRRLVRNVHIDGVWWGPDYDPCPPAAVADLITNPACWGEASTSTAMGVEEIAAALSAPAGLMYADEDLVVDDPGSSTPEPVADDAGSLVPDGSVPDVLDWVAGDLARAEQAYVTEQLAVKPRSTLLDQLDHIRREG